MKELIFHNNYDNSQRENGNESDHEDGQEQKGPLKRNRVEQPNQQLSQQQPPQSAQPQAVQPISILCLLPSDVLSYRVLHLLEDKDAFQSSRTCRTIYNHCLPNYLVKKEVRIHDLHLRYHPSLQQTLSIIGNGRVESC